MLWRKSYGFSADPSVAQVFWVFCCYLFPLFSSFIMCYVSRKSHNKSGVGFNSNCTGRAGVGFNSNCTGRAQSTCSFPLEFSPLWTWQEPAWPQKQRGSHWLSIKFQALIVIARSTTRPMKHGVRNLLSPAAPPSIACVPQHSCPDDSRPLHKYIG